jgi:PAS domain S-box-containing protein
MMNDSVRNTNQPQILVVDDSQASLKLLAEILSHQGYQVRPATDGTLALRSVAIEAPDLILLDIKMTGMDGYEVCRHLMSEEQSRHIPVIFISGLDEVTDKVKGFVAGAVDYITKPFDPAEVLARVETHLSLRRLQKELELAHGHLEQQVEARTAELAETNANLKAEIFERKRTEEALRESERRMSDIINFLPDATFAIDLEGRVIAWNHAIEEMTGTQADRVMGKGNHEYAVPFYGVRRPVLIDLIFGPHEETKEEYHFVEKKGNILLAEADIPIKGRENRVLWVIAGPLYDSMGNVVGAIESLRDITERRHVEQELRASEIRYRTIFENTGTAMIIAEEDMVISLCNAEIERLCGYPRDEIEGKMKWTDFVIADKLEEMKEFQRLRRIDIATASKSYETAIQDKEGNIRHVFVTVTMIPETKQSVASIIDITDRKQLQAQVYEAQKMEAIGTLAGGIAHDFNNILAGIMGYTELLLTKYKNDDQLRNYLERVYQAGERARSLVKQILTISRRVEQELQPMQVGPIIGEVLKLLRSSLPTTIEIRQDILISPEESIVVADPTQIHQVMMNICTNAAHAMRAKGGVLSVNLSKVDVNAAMASRIQDLHTGPHVKLTVSDTGHGMDAAVMERIFEPYFTTKGIGEGTGLGLAVVQGIVKSYGGAITVYSEPGKGTTFDILLPTTKQDIAQRIKSAEAPPTGNERILLIDDEEMMVDLGQRMLESLGYTVTTKTNSLEALEVFRTQPDAYDLVITDMTMPGMTGIDLAKALMAIRTNIPIILCTGYSDLINAEQAKEAGIRDFIMKPFMIARLAKGIRQVLETK